MGSVAKNKSEEVKDGIRSHRLSGTSYYTWTVFHPVSEFCLRRLKAALLDSALHWQ